MLSDYELGGAMNDLDLMAAIGRHADPPAFALVTGDVEAGLI